MPDISMSEASSPMFPPSPPASPRSPESFISAPSRATSLADLPPELVLHLAVYLSTRDALALAATTRLCHGTLNERIYDRHIRTEPDGDLPLWWAADQCTIYALATAKRALDHGADPNGVMFPPYQQGYEFYDTAMLKAVSNGHAAMVALLLEYGADPCAQSKECWPLQLAAKRRKGDYIECLRLMLCSSATSLGLGSGQTTIGVQYRRTQVIDHRGVDGWAALHVAASEGADDVVDLLLEHGARVDIRGFRRCTPLHEAIESGNLSTARKLIDAGADVLAFGFTKHSWGGGAGSNGLDKALDLCRCTVFNPERLPSVSPEQAREFIQSLLTKYRKPVSTGSGRRVNLPAGRAYRLLCPLGGWQPTHSLPFISMLLDSGLDPDARSEPDERTALWHYASMEAGYGPHRPEEPAALTAIIIHLLDAGASINFRDAEHRHTPLMRAVVAGTPKSVALLLSRGADVSLEDRLGCSVLALAAREKKLDSLTLLLNHERKENGDLADSIADLLHRVTARSTPLLSALKYCKVEASKLLLAHGARADVESNGGDSALALAVSTSVLVPVAPLLIESGAQLEERDCEGWTPLTRATTNGCLEGVGFLLREGVEVDALHHWPQGTPRSGQCETALVFAAERGELAIAEALIKAGASAARALECAPDLIERCEDAGYEEMIKILQAAL
ncbi:ankyrin repeat-containing domain protein [Microdochium bolleyi]|uniref:Ankyrin repeat-containing domain protein n=1 Tax=Microdochium bolleyi TaxID=196109 RepID=A0A136IR02_9PEZI|nr:ankyrin repeat-containing domain protein [Microdochium bolleyi]